MKVIPHYIYIPPLKALLNTHLGVLMAYIGDRHTFMYTPILYYSTPCLKALSFDESPNFDIE